MSSVLTAIAMQLRYSIPGKTGVFLRGITPSAWSFLPTRDLASPVEDPLLPSGRFPALDKLVLVFVLALVLYPESPFEVGTVESTSIVG
jgi:hypothetical protein